MHVSRELGRCCQRSRAGANHRVARTHARRPLHVALWHSAPLSLVQHLVDAAPEPLLHQDMFGLTPLAIAVGRGAELDVVELLLGAPQGLQALRLASASTYLPLHDAAAMGSPLPIVRVLMEADLSAAATPTRTGDLPLHIAAGGGRSPPEALRALALAFPLGAALANGRGRRPWELASENQLDASLIELLHVRMRYYCLLSVGVKMG